MCRTCTFVGVSLNKAVQYVRGRVSAYVFASVRARLQILFYVRVIRGFIISYLHVDKGFCDCNPGGGKTVNHNQAHCTLRAKGRICRALKYMESFFWRN